MAKEKYPKSSVYRHNRDMLEERARNATDVFREGKAWMSHKERAEMITDMFGSGVRPEKLSDDELNDIIDYVEFLSKRTGAAALHSKKFRSEVDEGSTQNALEKWSPTRSGMIGHDAMHGMWAWLRSGGLSFAPGFIDQPDEEGDNIAWMEERYTELLSDNFFDLREAFMADGVDASPDPVRRALLIWENSYGEPERSAYMTEHRMPELVAMARNLYAEMKKHGDGNIDPYFALREFQRTMKPVLERLRRARKRGQEAVLD